MILPCQVSLKVHEKVNAIRVGGNVIKLTATLPVRWPDLPRQQRENFIPLRLVAGGVGEEESALGDGVPSRCRASKTVSKVWWHLEGGALDGGLGLELEELWAVC